jgi:hypothetical protein
LVARGCCFFAFRRVIEYEGIVLLFARLGIGLAPSIGVETLRGMVGLDASIIEGVIVVVVEGDVVGEFRGHLFSLGLSEQD